MKKISIFFVFFMVGAVFVAASTKAECLDREWSLGRAIEVTPTNSTDPKWPPWKAKLGVCKDDSIIFTTKYFRNKPNSIELTKAFGKIVHNKTWFVNTKKNRIYYVFESDWNLWRQKTIGTQTALSILLLSSPERQPGPGNLAYTPDKPSPTSENEPILTLSTKAWQRVYAVGEMYAQIEVRTDGTAKMKYGQRIDADHIKFFDVRYDIPVSADWYTGITPFILSDMFPGYIFEGEFYPEDEKDIWSVQVFVPGYKHPAYTPDNKNPNAADEGSISLNESSWQNMYPIGSMYCQISLKNDNTFKIKFGVMRDGYVEIFNLYRNIPVPANWTRGQEPFPLRFTYPEYKFGVGSDPGASSDVWTARVWIP